MIELLKRRPLEEWLSEPTFKGTYIVYDRPERVYYVGQSNDVPRRLQQHIYKSGGLVSHAMKDFSLPYTRRLVNWIKRWGVAVTKRPEWEMILKLRPIHGPLQRQTFFYQMICHLGRTFGIEHPRYGRLTQFVSAINKRITRER